MNILRQQLLKSTYYYRRNLVIYIALILWFRPLCRSFFCESVKKRENFSCGKMKFSAVICLAASIGLVIDGNNLGTIIPANVTDNVHHLHSDMQVAALHMNGFGDKFSNVMGSVYEKMPSKKDLGNAVNNIYEKLPSKEALASKLGEACGCACQKREKNTIGKPHAPVMPPIDSRRGARGSLLSENGAGCADSDRDDYESESRFLSNLDSFPIRDAHQADGARSMFNMDGEEFNFSIAESREGENGQAKSMRGGNMNLSLSDITVNSQSDWAQEQRDEIEKDTKLFSGPDLAAKMWQRTPKNSNKPLQQPAEEKKKADEPDAPRHLNAGSQIFTFRHMESSPNNESEESKSDEFTKAKVQTKSTGGSDSDPAKQTSSGGQLTTSGNEDQQRPRQQSSGDSNPPLVETNSNSNDDVAEEEKGQFESIEEQDNVDHNAEWSTRLRPPTRSILKGESKESVKSQLQIKLPGVDVEEETVTIMPATNSNGVEVSEIVLPTVTLDHSSVLATQVDDLIKEGFRFETEQVINSKQNTIRAPTTPKVQYNLWREFLQGLPVLGAESKVTVGTEAQKLQQLAGLFLKYFDEAEKEAQKRRNRRMTQNRKSSKNLTTKSKYEKLLKTPAKSSSQKELVTTESVVGGSGLFSSEVTTSLVEANYCPAAVTTTEGEKEDDSNVAETEIPFATAAEGENIVTSVVADGKDVKTSTRRSKLTGSGGRKSQTQKEVKLITSVPLEDVNNTKRARSVNEFLPLFHHHEQANNKTGPVLHVQVEPNGNITVGTKNAELGRNHGLEIKLIGCGANASWKNGQGRLLVTFSVDGDSTVFGSTVTLRKEMVTMKTTLTEGKKAVRSKNVLKVVPSTGNTSTHLQPSMKTLLRDLGADWQLTATR